MWPRRTKTRLFAEVSRLWKASGGAAAAEFAIIGPILFLFVFGLYEVGRMFWIQNAIQFAAEETERYFIAHFTNTVAGCTSGALLTTFNSNLAGISSSDPNLLVVFTPVAVTPSVTPVKSCQILATYSFPSIYSVILPAGYKLVGEAQSPF